MAIPADRGIDSNIPRSLKPKSEKKQPKICKKCNLPIVSQFVRALNSTYHVECFVCNTCGKQCSAKFFTIDMVDNEQGIKTRVPLCEYDYFHQLDLICYSCDSALRGPYITALGRKYHLDHFKCAVCKRVFKSDESFYEHDDEIYCHFHYSVLYALSCQGCGMLIVKQFVELFRGGKNQQWHPECYMVHKFWNVAITSDYVGLTNTLHIQNAQTIDVEHLKSSDISSDTLISIQNQIDVTVLDIWRILLNFEETTAACISGMLLLACTCNQAKGMVVASQLVLNIEMLFNAIDAVILLCMQSRPLVPRIESDTDDSELEKEKDKTPPIDPIWTYYQPLRKEPRNLSGKLMGYFAILRNSAKIPLSGTLSAELLSIITSLAHYLKLLIRMGLQNALKVNKLTGTDDATKRFLAIISTGEAFNNDIQPLPATIALMNKALEVPLSATDICKKCSKYVEKQCINYNHVRWHVKCFKCTKCGHSIDAIKNAPDNVNKQATLDIPVHYDENEKAMYCDSCAQSKPGISMKSFQYITDLEQLTYLLKIAISRSRTTMHISSDGTQLLTQNMRGMDTVDEEQINVDYRKTIKDVTSLRSKRQSQKLQTSIEKNARKSIILDVPQADKADTSSENDDSYSSSQRSRNVSGTSLLSYKSREETEQFQVKPKSLLIRDEPQRQLTNSHLDRTSDLLHNEKSLTLDDIPRIVAAEQAREQRPNAFKHNNSLLQKPSLSVNGFTPPTIALQSTLDTPIEAAPHGYQEIELLGGQRIVSKDSLSHSKRLFSGNIGNLLQNGQLKYFSELTKNEHYILRFIAIEALAAVHSNVNKEDMYSLIQIKKQLNFWEKFKFGSNKEKAPGVFGVELHDLTRKYGTESDLGVGPSKLKIPAVVDDIIVALRLKDVSVQYIFRLNGNIKKLRHLTEEVNKSPSKSPNFANETAIQLAALLKKWLRDLPTPLLTFNFYELWLGSQMEPDLVKRKRMLQLAYALLPRCNRNLLEVLLYFFNWVASFAEIDKETGSKMDILNISTVIAPNILYSKENNSLDVGHDGAQPDIASGDKYFLSIEVINQLLEIHEELCIIPSDLLVFYEKCGFSSSGNLNSKEIISKIDKALKEEPDYFEKYIHNDSHLARSPNQVHSGSVRGRLRPNDEGLKRAHSPLREYSQ